MEPGSPFALSVASTAGPAWSPAGPLKPQRSWRALGDGGRFSQRGAEVISQPYLMWFLVRFAAAQKPLSDRVLRFKCPFEAGRQKGHDARGGGRFFGAEGQPRLSLPLKL